jgi:hypothetical protein
MNRRSFLKFGALTGLALIIPMNIVVDNKDGETKWIEHLLSTTDDEMFIIESCKEYLYVMNSAHKEYTFRCKEFVQRQPYLIKCLRARIDKNDKTSRYYKSKLSSNWTMKLKVAKEYNLVAGRFNLPLVPKASIDNYTSWAKSETKSLI